MLDQKLIDREYSYLGDVVFADFSTVSMPPLRVQRMWKEYIEGYVRAFGSNYPDYFTDKTAATRKEMAALFRVSPEEIAFTHSASDSMTILANSFPFLQGDNVIVTSEEHASNVVPWLALERRGIEVRVVHSVDGAVSVDSLLAAADERTRIISVASVFFCSGYAIDLKALGEGCRKRSITLAVDGTQSVGKLALYPKELGVDYLAGGGHKGLLGTKSVGFAYCSKELLARLTPYTGSLQGVLNAGRPCTLEHYDQIQWANTASKLESGNYPFATVEAMGTGASLINELGIENVEARIRQTEDTLRPLKTNDFPKENRSGLVFIHFPERVDAERVREILWKYKVRAVVRYDYIRLSLHFINTPGQMDRVADALAEISEL